LKQVLSGLAFLCSLLSLLLIGGGGVALFAIQISGERGMGALLALGGAIAFGAVMVLLFAKQGTFASAAGRAVAIGAAIIGALPVAAIAFAAIRFAGIPLGSGTPAIDWSMLAAGLVLTLGTIAILAIGHRRSQEGQPKEIADAAINVASEVPVIHMQQIRHAQQQLRAVFEADRRSETDQTDDDIRVRKV
jgi:hypothetical protein